MRVITIKIDDDNDAFLHDGGDVNLGAVADAVRDIAGRIQVGQWAGRLHDLNGNKSIEFLSETT